LALRTAHQSFYVILGTLSILQATYAIAQTATPLTPVTPQAAAISATPAAPASLVISAPSAAPEPGVLAKSPISVSGILDGYYDFDANHPDDGDTQLRNFDIRANTVSLTEAKIVLAHDPAPFGIRADIGLGSAFEVMHPSNPSGGGLKYVEQMFVSAKPAKWKGFEADFGQFVTSAGAEIIESADNWNYSRSLLFSFAIPYYHFGVRTSMPVTSTITAGVQVVQGWNNIFDNNSGKTVGITAVQAKKYYTLNANYYVGPENNNTDHGYRNLLDATLLLTPSAKFNAYINYDYGQNRNANSTNTGVGSLAHWQGIAGAAHVQATSKITATVRGEYFSDPNGFTTGTVQKLNEVTGTADYLIHAGILARAEYRHDHSNQLYFQKNGIPASVNGQSTFEVSLIAFFGPKT
jgi:Putative beta-barrel porin-2, OmpL-like. bbp2